MGVGAEGVCVGLRTPRSLWLRIQIWQGPGRKGDGADRGLGWGEAFGEGGRKAVIWGGGCAPDPL